MINMFLMGFMMLVASSLLAAVGVEKFCTTCAKPIVQVREGEWRHVDSDYESKCKHNALPQKTYKTKKETTFFDSVPGYHEGQL